WLGAMRTLEANVRAGVIDKPAAQHKRAALLTARAMELEAGEPMEARAAALEAHRLDPSLVPAAVVGSRLLSRASDYRRAARVLEATWKAEPHPDIADAYATVRPGDSVRDRLKRMRRLVELRANHPEGAKAIARAAIDALDWTAARDALDGQVKAGPSEAVCLLMAEIEEREHGDEGKVRMWLARAINAPRDPVWMADGQILDHWMPVSPVSGEVGIVAWKVSPEVPPSRVALQIEADLAIERQTSIDAVETPRIEAKPVAVPEPAPVEDVEPVEPAEVVAAPPEAPAPEVEVEPEPEPAVATVEATPEEVAPSRGGDGAKPQESAARTEPEPEPASEPGPEPSPDEIVSETAEAKEEVDGEPVEEEPVVPPSPDDPGPMPDGDDLEAPKRRFRLF
ncbi:MAG: heme biosynthesis protein HemY, partial [Bauldia sp.]|uniref:heme biosynthesis protein HemY n=1 Tax=Bauldia sp. TaxID=2575872 RepID=UPI001DE531B2|nr:heme biosynthesis protein HemY [Bauldia sp.]